MRRGNCRNEKSCEKKATSFFFWMLSSLITLLSTLSLASAQDIALYSGGTKLRGANMYQQEKYAEAGNIWNPKIDARDLVDLRNKGANFVNFSVPGIYDVRTYAPRADFEGKLDQLVAMATAANLYVVLSFRTGPGRGEGRITGDGFNNGELFTSVAAQNAFVEMWKAVATKYKNHPNVIGYDLLVEPHDIATSVWRALAQRLVTEIRTIDADTPMLVSLPDWGNYAQITSWVPLAGENLVYTIHQYDPFEYTHNNTASDEINALNGIYATIQNWINIHNKPIFINEFGLAVTVSNGTNFMNAQIAKIEAIGMGHAAWIWEVAYDPDYDYAVFDFKKNAPLMSVYSASWVRNTMFPAGGGPVVVPTIPAAFAYNCGSNTGYSGSLFSSKMFVERNCDTGAISLKSTGSLFKKTHQGQVSSTSENVTVSARHGLASDDSVTQVNTKRADFSYRVRGSEVNGFTFGPVGADSKTCFKIIAPSKVKLYFGPDETETVFYAGESVNLATMQKCL